MKTNTLKRASALTATCLALMNAPIAQAATINGSLGVPASSVDLYVLGCPAGTHHVSGNITDRAPVRAPLVTLKMIKGVTKSETTDPVDGVQAQVNPPLIGEFSSPTVNINMGAGKYYLLVEKSAAGSETYRVFVECRDAFSNPLAPVSGPSPASTPTSGLTDAARTAAATATAQSRSNACALLPSFYWEIGDWAKRIASGSMHSSGSVITSTTMLSVASASKWMYGAYVVEKRSGLLTAQDIKFLNFRSGYSSFGSCASGDTVGSCLATWSNGAYTPATDGKFFYDGGHMQKHASLIGLDGLDNAALAAEVRGQIGPEIAMTYTQPQPAGGVRTSAQEYAKFLRKMLSGDLRMGSALGTHAVCTNPATCASAVSTPIPGDESRSYSLGHWVEDDPTVGDGAFSSPGAFGFYPWIDSDKAYYGIVARAAGGGAAIESVKCGRLIRKAWMTGNSY